MLVPLALVFPKGAREELLPRAALPEANLRWQRHKQDLGALLYRREHLRNGNATDAHVRVRPVQTTTGWELPIGRTASPQAWGAYPSVP